MRTPALLLVLCAALGIDAAAEMLPTLSIRYMTIEAEVIVVAEPVDGDAGVLPTRYRVLEVLKGGGGEKGQEIAVAGGDMYVLGPPRGSRKDETPPPRIQKALLFLQRKEAGQETCWPVCSGIRALSKDDELLVPEQQGNPGPMYLLPVEDGSWDAMVAEVRADLPRIEEIVQLGAMPDRAERNKAVLSWIERHKSELRHFAGRGRGWGSLEPRLIEWIMESCIPEDCWRAVELSAELDVRPEKSYPSFCSQAGRRLLLEKFVDTKASDSLRVAALGALGGACWDFRTKSYPGTGEATEAEQREIIAAVLPLLEDKDASWRRAAVWCLLHASASDDTNLKRLATKDVAPRLADLYATEQHPEVRVAVVDAIRRLETEEFWRGLSGNPLGIVVRISFEGVVRGSCRFGLNLDHTRARITEPPTLTIERLDGHGRVVETRSVPPDVTHPEKIFERGWERGRGQVGVEIPALAPGTWQVTAVGVVGEPRETWRSEPVRFEIPEPQK